METKDFIIGVDMDDTIENLLDAWVTWLNNKYGTHVDINEMTKWEVGYYFPTLTSDQVYEPLLTDSFWDTVTPKEDAIIWLKKLYDEGFTIYICTNSHYHSLRVKLDNVLFKYFPFIEKNKVITIANKQLLKLDVLVDDYYKNLINGSYTGILYHTAHSRTINHEEMGLIKVFNWEQVYYNIHKLYDEKCVQID